MYTSIQPSILDLPTSLIPIKAILTYSQINYDLFMISSSVFIEYADSRNIILLFILGIFLNYEYRFKNFYHEEISWLYKVPVGKCIWII